MADRSESWWGDPGARHEALVISVVLFGVPATVLGVVGLVVHHYAETPASPYRVEFGRNGDGCDGDDDPRHSALTLNREDGEVLFCNSSDRACASTTSGIARSSARNGTIPRCGIGRTRNSPP